MGHTDRKRSRAARLGAAAVTLLFVAAGCGGTAGGVGSGAADLVPAGTPVYIAVDTNPDSDQWKTVERLAKRFPDYPKAIREAKQSMREDSGLEWERDIKPALGDEVDVVVFNISADHADVVGMLQPHDEGKFKAAMKKANETDPSDPAIYEKFKDWYLISDKQRAIDSFEQQSSSAQAMLADDDTFNHAMDKLGSDAIARAFVDGSQIMRLIRENAGPGERPLIQKAGTLDWIGARLGAKDDGIGFDAVVHGTPGKLWKGLSFGKGFKPQLMHDVPSDALVYWTFHGSKNMFTAVQNNPVFKQAGLGPLGGVLRQIGTILQGENALYVRRHPAGFLPEITFVAAPGGGVDGAATLDRVLRRFRSDLGIVPRRTTVAGTAARRLVFGPDVPFDVYYANVDGKLVVTDLRQGIRGVKNPGKPLSTSDEFQNAKSSSKMPDKTQGFLYVNIHSTIPAVEDIADTPIPNEVRRNLRPLRSAVEYAVARSHEIKVSLFLRIK